MSRHAQSDNNKSIPSNQSPTGDLNSLVSESQSDSLGKIAKFASQPQNSDHKGRDNATLYRFELQSYARKLLGGKRVANCLRLLIPTKLTVDIYHVPDRDSAHYHNLRTCDSVWDCPVCAAKITERRRLEMMLGVAKAFELGLIPVLVTFTLQHNRGDKLRDLLTALKLAYRKFKSGRAYQTLKEDFKIAGSVTSTEVTHGHKREKNNGWHPHLHALFFLRPSDFGGLVSMESQFRERWTHVLNALGYDASWEHGLTLKEGDSEIAEYVAKWGHEPAGTRWTVERELTKAPVKQASKDGATPFQLLALYGAGDEVAGQLFKEYSDVFHGRAQLVWSRGLRALLGMDKESSDEDANADETENQVLMLQLSRSRWWKVLNLPSDQRGEILVVASAGDIPALETFLTALVGEDENPPPDRDEGKNMIVQCPDCLGDAHYLKTGHDSQHGHHKEYWCRTCAESVYIPHQPATDAPPVSLESPAYSDTDQRDQTSDQPTDQQKLWGDIPTVWY